MKIARTTGMATIVAMAFMASLGAGSALAVETALCKSGTVAPYCKSENLYPAKTALKASSSEVTVNFPFLESNKVKCTESTLEGETSSAAGKPMPFAVSAWTLGGCETQSGTKCTVTATERAPYSGSLSWATYWDGTMTIGDGGKGKPGWNFLCGKQVRCTVAFAPDLGANGGSPATIVATGESMSIEEGAICPPESSTFSGTYSVSSPNIAFVTRAEAPPAPTTGLCKEVFSAWCEQAYQYPKGTTIEAESSNLTFENGSFIYGNVTCEKSSITAKTTAAYAEPLPIDTTSFTLANCKFHNGIGCAIAATSYPSGSLSHTLLTPNGKWVNGLSSLTMNCGKTIECAFTPPSGSTMTLEGGSPAAIRAKSVELEVSGSVCPTSVKMSADFTVTSPNPLYVTDMVR